MRVPELGQVTEISLGTTAAEQLQQRRGLLGESDVQVRSFTLAGQRCPPVRGHPLCLLPQARMEELWANGHGE